MFALVGGLAGAAAVQLLNHGRKHHPQQPADVEELQKQKSALQKLVTELQREAADTRLQAVTTGADLAARTEQLQGVLQQVEELQHHVETLSMQNTSFVEQNEELKGQNLDLNRGLQAMEEENSMLQQRVTEVAAERQALMQEIDSLKAELHELRDRVSDVMNDMLAHKLTEKDGAEALLSLGCSIHYVEPEPEVASAPAQEAQPEAPRDLPALAAPTPTTNMSLPWSQPTLLLENRERLERLVVSSMMMHKLEAGKPGAGHTPNRVPVVTFPMGHMLTNKLEGGGAPGTPRANKPMNTAFASLEDGSSNSSNKDVPAAQQRDQQQQQQAQSSGKTPNISIGTPGKATKKEGSGINFVYSLQGSKGNNWVAKVPVAEDAAPTFFTPGKPGLLGKDTDDLFGGFDSGSKDICLTHK